MSLRGAGGGSFDGISEVDNEVYNADPCVIGTEYSSPIEMGSRLFLGLAVRFVKGSLSSMTITAEVWDGEGWVTLNDVTETGKWQYALTADGNHATHVGDIDGTEQDLQKITWNRIRFKIVAAGTATSSSLKIRVSAK
jgi:hypothetical protein